MMKLSTKIILLVCSVIISILLLNQYPVSMSLKKMMQDAGNLALQDITTQLSLSSDLKKALDNEDSTALYALAKQTEDCENCSGLAILDKSFQIIYNSEQDKIDPQIIKRYQASMPVDKPFGIITPDNGILETYAFSPVYGLDGNLLGSIIAKLQHEQNQAGLQKAQRDLNAMTVLVMLIAVIFVWQLTDNIKGTMFNLEPVEIAQLLVERNSLIDAVRDGIFSVDQNGQMIHANSAALRLFERSLENFDRSTCSFFDIFPHVLFHDIIKGNQPIYDIECPIGPDSYYVNFIPIKIEKPRYNSLMVTFRLRQEIIRFAEDITGVKSYIEALRAQMHEFNNKLQVVSGLVQEKKYPELEQYIFTLIHLKNREILQINGKIKDSILAAFLMSKFDRAAEQKVDLILTDRSELRTNLPLYLVQDLIVIVGNLLENAFDAVQNCAMQTVILELVETAGEISVSVWDSGSDIPEELRERLFDYGVTTKKDGSGIGLYLVRQSCRRLNGYVTVISSPQDGTEFIAHIPFLKEQEGENVPVFYY